MIIVFARYGGGLKEISRLDCNSVTDLSHSTLELFKEYQEEAYTISLHPSGHFIVVGFADKLRLMNLLIDDIRSFKEYSVRGCREVRCWR